MLPRGLRIGVVGIFLILLALWLHTVLPLYNAPEGFEFDLLNIFAATFASTILTFFIGILVADYQIENDSASKSRRLGALLDAELSQILEELDQATPTRLPLPDGSTAEVVVSDVQPLVLAEAIRLVGKIQAHNAKVSYLMSILSLGGRGVSENGRCSCRSRRSSSSGRSSSPPSALC